MRVLLVGGSPQPSSAACVRALAYTCEVVVAVDHGFDYALAAGLEPDLFVGDGDTLSPRGKLLLEEAGTERLVFDPHKDATDLGLALSAVGGRWPGADIVATCFSGGSPDHFLGVCGRLASFDAGRIGIREDAFLGRILKAGDIWEISGAQGARFSFLPLCAEAELSLSGMEWNLDHAHVGLLSDLGISNIIRKEDALAQVHEGVAIAYLFSE